LQSFHAVADPTRGGEEPDRGLHAGTAHRLDDPEPVEAGQHAVDDHHIISLSCREEEAVTTVRSDVDHMTVLLKPSLHVSAGFDIVFDEKNFHMRVPPFKRPKPF